MSDTQTVADAIDARGDAQPTDEYERERDPSRPLSLRDGDRSSLGEELAKLDARDRVLDVIAPSNRRARFTKVGRDAYHLWRDGPGGSYSNDRIVRRGLVERIVRQFLDAWTDDDDRPDGRKVCRTDSRDALWPKHSTPGTTTNSDVRDGGERR